MMKKFAYQNDILMSGQLFQSTTNIINLKSFVYLKFNLNILTNIPASTYSVDSLESNVE